MDQVIEAVFEEGVFKPVQAVELPEGQKVSLTVEPVRTAPSPEEMLRAARRVYEGLSDEEIEAVEAVALDRDHFFHRG